MSSVFCCVCEISSSSSSSFFYLGLAQIGCNLAQTQRNEYTRLQVRLFQFISRDTPQIRVLFHPTIIRYKPSDSRFQHSDRQTYSFKI